MAGTMPMDEFKIPRTLYDEMKDAIARSMGYASLDALYAAEDNAIYEFPEMAEAFLTRAIKRELRAVLHNFYPPKSE